MLIALVFGSGAALSVRSGRPRRPLHGPDDTVSEESPLCTPETGTTDGTGGNAADGDNNPFLVEINDNGRDPPENMFFVLGADATRRMNRLATPILDGDVGDGPEGNDGMGKEVCSGLAV
jgi:hypothetical protein